jgi:hypothetical protein
MPSSAPACPSPPARGAALVLPAPGDLRAITVRHLWAWSFTTARLDPAGRKDTENRSWKLPARYRGVPVALHAGQARGNATLLPVPAAAAFRQAIAAADPMLAPGTVLAVITFTGCHDSANCAAPAASCSPWALPGERFHWHAGPVTPLAEPVPCSGALGFWQVPGEVHAAILARLPAGTRTAPPAPRPPRPARRKPGAANDPGVA